MKKKTRRVFYYDQRVKVSHVDHGIYVPEPDAVEINKNLRSKALTDTLEMPNNSFQKYLLPTPGEQNNTLEEKKEKKKKNWLVPADFKDKDLENEPSGLWDDESEILQDEFSMYDEDDPFTTWENDNDSPYDEDEENSTDEEENLLSSTGKDLGLDLTSDFFESTRLDASISLEKVESEGEEEEKKVNFASEYAPKKSTSPIRLSTPKNEDEETATEEDGDSYRLKAFANFQAEEIKNDDFSRTEKFLNTIRQRDALYRSRTSKNAAPGSPRVNFKETYASSRPRNQTVSRGPFGVELNVKESIRTESLTTVHTSLEKPQSLMLYTSDSSKIGTPETGLSQPSFPATSSLTKTTDSFTFGNQKGAFTQPSNSKFKSFHIKSKIGNEGSVFLIKGLDFSFSVNFQGIGNI